MIGAEVPHQLAQELEAAAKDGNTDFVLSNHDAFLKEYDTVLEAIRKAVPDDDGGADEFEVDESGAMEFFPETDTESE